MHKSIFVYECASESADICSQALRGIHAGQLHQRLDEHEMSIVRADLAMSGQSNDHSELSDRYA